MGQYEVLTVGSADLCDAYMFKKVKLPPASLRVTELRTAEQLTTTYGQSFLNRLTALKAKNVGVEFGVDALQLTANDLRNVKLLYWGCPHFSVPDFSGLLRRFFANVDNVTQEQIPPVIGIALDCLGPDSSYNLSTRFEVFTIPGWRVDCVVDLSKYYKFTPTNPTEIGRKKLAAAIRPYVHMLVFTKNPTKPHFLNEKNMPIFFSSKSTTDPTPYVNFAQIPVVNFRRFIKALHKIDDVAKLHEEDISAVLRLRVTGFEADKRKAMNCFTVPTDKHIARPTSILKIIEDSNVSWQEAWVKIKGGMALPRMKKESVSFFSSNESPHSLSSPIDHSKIFTTRVK